MNRLKSDNVKLFWFLLEPCDWKSIRGLENVQTIGSLKTAISECKTEADGQSRLIEVVDRFIKAFL